jgi:hypothetical protein
MLQTAPARMRTSPVATTAATTIRTVAAVMAKAMAAGIDTDNSQL